MDHFTQRSKQLNKYKQSIESKKKYQKAIKNGQFIIQNNPTNNDCIYNKQDDDEIKQFFDF